MEYKNDFKFDLKVGQVGEKMLGDILEGAKIEVKRDSWITKSGNIAIEYWSYGKPSGISITEADWWCLILAGDMEDKMMLLVETAKLKKIVKYYHKKGCIKCMGDNNVAKAVLIPWAELVNSVNKKK